MNQTVLSNIDSLPPLLSTHDLVEMGLYSSIDAAYLARIHGDSPDFIRLKRKILYKKSSVIEFIEQRTCRGDKPQATSTASQQSNDAK